MKNTDLKSQIILCLVSHASFSSISSFILPFSNFFTGILAFIGVFCFLEKIAHCTTSNYFCLSMFICKRLCIFWSAFAVFFDHCLITQHWRLRQKSHCLETSYYGNFLEGLGSNEFHIKWRFCTHGSWKKSKSWWPFCSYQLNSTANLTHLPRN
mgnify:CR=1 FL=1